MELLVAFLFVVGMMVLWVYYYFQPKVYDDRKKNALFIFNGMILFVLLMLCFFWMLNVKVLLGGTTADHHVKPVALAGALAIEIVFLSCAFIARNFWIFKPPRNPFS